MAEDWGKWQKDWDRLAPKAQKLSLDEAGRLVAALTARDKAIETHEKAFVQAVLKAWDKGMTVKTLDAFLKDKAVADAKKLLDTDRRLLSAEIAKVEDYCKDCDTAAKPIDKFTDQMAKAIKSTKEKSAERDKAKKLFDAIQAKLKDLHEASHLRFKLDKFLLAFDKQFDKWLAHVLSEALKKTKEKDKEDEDLPAPLDEKKLKLSGVAVEKLRLAMEKALRAALTDAGEDGKKLPDLLKAAQAALSEIKKEAGRVKGLGEKYRKQIAGSSKDDATYKLIDGVVEIFKGAEADYKLYIGKISAAQKLRDKSRRA